jgi:hypothetical protein
MLSQKLLVNVGINMLVGRNQPLAAFAKPDAHFARIASFRPFAVVQVHAIIQQLFHIENRFFAIAEVLANICMLLSCNEL